MRVRIRILGAAALMAALSGALFGMSSSGGGIARAPDGNQVAAIPHQYTIT